MAAIYAVKSSGTPSSDRTVKCRSRYRNKNLKPGLGECTKFRMSCIAENLSYNRDNASVFASFRSALRTSWDRRKYYS